MQPCFLEFIRGKQDIAAWICTSTPSGSVLTQLHCTSMSLFFFFFLLQRYLWARTLLSFSDNIHKFERSEFDSSCHSPKKTNDVMINGKSK